MLIVVTHFGVPHKHAKKIRKKYVEESNIYILERLEIAKDRLRRIKISKFENLTAYFRLIKALLVRKIQFNDENPKLGV